MAALIIAEHENGQLKNNTFGVLDVCYQLDIPCHILIFGSKLSQVAKQAASIKGVDKILSCEAEHLDHPIAENMLPTIVDVSTSYTHILAPHSTFGKNVMPKLAALLDIDQISDLTEVISKDTFVRPIYAGNALATVSCKASTKVLTVRTSAFSHDAQQSSTIAAIETVQPSKADERVQFESIESPQFERPELTSAKVVVSGGRALQSKENFELIGSLADTLKGAVGASRAAVDAGFVPNDYQVGQTGKMVAPDLYIAIGISGAVQHLAGIKDSKVIVAINKDEEAPIFQIADYGLVGDLFKIVPELKAGIEKLLHQ